LGGGAGAGGNDGFSWQSPAGAARTESDDDDANDARRREEFDGNLMKNISSDEWCSKKELINAGKERGKDFELIHCELYML